MPPYATTVVRSEDEKQIILDLWHRNLEDVPNGKYEWLYESGRGENWVVRDGDTCIGSVGLMHRTIVAGDREFRAAQPVDLNVEANCRMGRAAISMQRTINDTVLEGQYDLLFSFPGRSSECVLRRVGYDALRPLERWVLPVRSEAHLPERISHPAARRLLGTAGDVYLKIRRAAGGLATGLRGFVDTAVSDRFDASFDRHWEAAVPLYRLLGRRDAAYLNWRFGDCPGPRHRVFSLRGLDGAILGYTVYCIQDGTVHLNDFLCSDAKVWPRLLGEFLRFVLSTEPCDRVVAVFIGPDYFATGFKRFGFYRRATDWNLYIFAGCSEEPRRGFNFYNPGDWFITRADLDTSV